MKSSSGRKKGACDELIPEFPDEDRENPHPKTTNCPHNRPGFRQVPPAGHNTFVASIRFGVL
ncbi:MAG: hypothetical protein WCF92_02470 [bacterium]